MPATGTKSTTGTTEAPRDDHSIGAVRGKGQRKPKELRHQVVRRCSLTKRLIRYRKQQGLPRQYKGFEKVVESGDNPLVRSITPVLISFWKTLGL